VKWSGAVLRRGFAVADLARVDRKTCQVEGFKRELGKEMERPQFGALAQLTGRIGPLSGRV